MIEIRGARWPNDADGLYHLDAGYATDHTYTVETDDVSFRVRETSVSPTYESSHLIDRSVIDEIAACDYCAVAVDSDTIIGIVAASHEVWNRRLVIRHLYADAKYRGVGVGRRLVDSVDQFGTAVSARCIHLETQNVNYPAIQFYRHIGFKLCGYDDSLYDPRIVPHGEVALFFSRPIATAL